MPPTDRSFGISRGDAGGHPLVRYSGRLTIGEGSRSLRGSLSGIAAEGHKTVLLDMAGVTYVDSSGLGAMVAGYNSLRLQGGSVVLFNVPKRVQDLIEMSGLTIVFRIFGSEQEALAGVRN